MEKIYLVYNKVSWQQQLTLSTSQIILCVFHGLHLLHVFFLTEPKKALQYSILLNSTQFNVYSVLH